MQRFRSRLPTILAVLCSFAASAHGSARHPLKRHWKITASETVWTGRYNNCDYGYYVALPKGVVGHSTLPPSPNHGFLVALPDVGTMKYALDRQRSIWVDTSYNTSDVSSLSGLVGEQVSKGTIFYKTRSRIAGLSAIQVRSRQGKGASGLIEVTTLALRADIVYTVGMRTNSANIFADGAEYKRILAGLKLLPLSSKECSNG